MRGVVGAVYLDGEDLVLLDLATLEWAREESDLDRGQLAEAFAAHGYQWHADGDPHRGDYRRWVSDTPDLPGPRTRC